MKKATFYNNTSSYFLQDLNRQGQFWLWKTVQAGLFVIIYCLFLSNVLFYRKIHSLINQLTITLQSGVADDLKPSPVCRL